MRKPPKPTRPARQRSGPARSEGQSGGKLRPDSSQTGRKPRPGSSQTGRKPRPDTAGRATSVAPKGSKQETPSEIKTIPAAISTARAGKPASDPTAQRVVRSSERFAEKARLHRRLLLRKYLIGAVILAAVLTGAWLVFFSSVFSLRSGEVSVMGAGEFVNKSEVVAVLDSEVGTPLARLDLDEISQRVAQVRGVSSGIVRRDWPHGVRVSVAQRTPVAAVKSDDTYVLLDADGVRVGEVDEAPDDLALAKVPLKKGRESSLAAVLTVLDAIPPELREEITEIGADTRDTVYFALQDDVRVEWGSADDSALKVSVLSVLRQEDAKVYDVSAPTLPVTRNK